MSYTVPSPNVPLISGEDKLGHMMYEIKTRLVGTGRWRVRGSGDDVTVQLIGQTAGVGGSYDVFVTQPVWLPVVYYNSPPNWCSGGAGRLSRGYAWYVLEEIASGRCMSIQRATSYSPDAAGTWTIRFMPGGVASAGATPQVPPACGGERSRDRASQ